MPGTLLPHASRFTALCCRHKRPRLPPASRSDGIRDIYSAEGNAIDATTPLVVLTNRGTASASEVRNGGLSSVCFCACLLQRCARQAGTYSAGRLSAVGRQRRPSVPSTPARAPPLHRPALPHHSRLHLQVLAGALKDNKRASVAGETTFGKGLIQTVVELSDGSAVAVTVAKYQTPAGLDINKARLALFSFRLV